MSNGLMIDPDLKPVERLIFRSPLVFLARYCCGPDDPLFANSGPSNANAIAFPRTSTRIIRASGTLVQNPTAASFYNEGEEYSCEPLGGQGSDCQWFTFDADVLFELAGIDRSARIGRGPFRVPQTPVDAPLVLRQRCLFRYAAAYGASDPLTVEEEALAIARRILPDGSSPPDLAVSLRRRTTVQRTIEWIAANFSAPASLSVVARQVGVSPAHLSRTFHDVVGTTMHGFREELRLRRALDLLPDCSGGLSRLAFELGYSSHSHFSERFRRKFGMTPQQFVRA
jgi:AraC family transcriptional regulator